MRPALVIGDGTGPGGEADDSRTALRSQQDRADLTDTTMVSGRLAFRGNFSPASSYSVTEAGIIARIGDDGAEFLFAFWTVASTDDALATSVPGGALLVAGVLDVTAAAEVSVVVEADITFAAPGTLVALTDVPDAYTAGLHLRANNTATAGVWNEAPPVVATESALPAADAAVNSV